MNDSATHPLQFLLDEAERLRPIAESTAPDELQVEGKKIEEETLAILRSTSNRAGRGDDLQRAGMLLARASALASEREDARKRLAEIDGLLNAERDCRVALDGHRSALEKLATTIHRRDRIHAVVAEIESELAELRSARADELARASSEAVRARLDGRPRPEPPADRHGDRRAVLQAERDQARAELDTAEAAVHAAEQEAASPRASFFEARHRLAQARYCWALAAFVPYLADLTAAASLADMPRPSFEWRPSSEEVATAEQLIRTELESPTPTENTEAA